MLLHPAAIATPGNPALSLLTLQWPSPLMAVIAGTLIIAWWYGRTTAKALTAATLGMALLHGLAWLAYGSANSLHALCSAIGLGLILPIALRSRRLYPLAAGAAALLAVLALSCATLLEGQSSLAAQLIAALANAVLVIALWAGIFADWRRQRAPLRGSQANNLPQRR